MYSQTSLYLSSLGDDITDIIRYDNEINTTAAFGRKMHPVRWPQRSSVSLRTFSCKIPPQGADGRPVSGRWTIPAKCFNCAPRISWPIRRWDCGWLFQGRGVSCPLTVPIYLYYDEIDGIRVLGTILWKEIGFWEMGWETGRVLKLLYKKTWWTWKSMELGPPAWQDELFYLCTDYIEEMLDTGYLDFLGLNIQKRR